jgi:hypothetical protein
LHSFQSWAVGGASERLRAVGHWGNHRTMGAGSIRVITVMLSCVRA